MPSNVRGPGPAGGGVVGGLGGRVGVSGIAVKCASVSEPASLAAGRNLAAARFTEIHGRQTLPLVGRNRIEN
jgi:hypothetical protein